MLLEECGLWHCGGLREKWTLKGMTLLGGIALLEYCGLVTVSFPVGVGFEISFVQASLSVTLHLLTVA